MTKLVILGRKSQTGNYETFFSKLPARTVTTLVPGEVTSCDALILPGGGDITPAFFGEKNKGSRTVDTELDILQFQALDTAIAARIPVIGICKGMQVINVAFGGTILQDMSGDSLHSIPSGDAFHTSIMTEDSRLFKYFPVKMHVNSAHHQRDVYKRQEGSGRPDRGDAAGNHPLPVRNRQSQGQRGAGPGEKARAQIQK